MCTSNSKHDDSAAVMKVAVCPRERHLVDGAGMIRTVAVMLYCHFCVALLCLNVMFDLFFLGAPVFLLHKIRLLPTKLYLSVTTFIISWTTPIVFTMPMIFSGTKMYCNDIDLLIEAKSKNSLLLANHGSRIDWMVGMFTGFSRSMADRSCERIRVGFVCEALIQFMPLIGWYRKLVAHDIFLWRSFKQDAPTIKKNIHEYHSANERRMLFLSPEGIVVDFGSKDMKYIAACRKFCLDQNYEPFEYVLTPRYKGSMCLLDQVQHGKGPVVSICVAYVQDGKLLNCSLLSPDRVVPDIYSLNQGINGKPIDIYIHLKKMNLAQDMNDPKTFMMENYKEKNEILAEWDQRLLAGRAGSKSWMSQFSVVKNNSIECYACQIGHTVTMLLVAIIFDRLQTLLNVFGTLFCLVSGCHTIGWLLNSTSMESVPFETGIKSIALALQNRKSRAQNSAKTE